MAKPAIAEINTGDPMYSASLISVIPFNEVPGAGQTWLPRDIITQRLPFISCGMDGARRGFVPQINAARRLSFPPSAKELRYGRAGFNGLAGGNQAKMISFRFKWTGNFNSPGQLALLWSMQTPSNQSTNSGDQINARIVQANYNNGALAIAAGNGNNQNTQTNFTLKPQPSNVNWPNIVLVRGTLYTMTWIWDDAAASNNGYAASIRQMHIWDESANGGAGGRFLGVTATATCTQSGGVINSFTISNPSTTAFGGNYGYDSANPPTVTITGGPGTGAVITLNFTASTIISGTITNGGSGYTGTPTVTIGPPVGYIKATATGNKLGDTGGQAGNPTDLVFSNAYSSFGGSSFGGINLETTWELDWWLSQSGGTFPTPATLDTYAANLQAGSYGLAGGSYATGTNPTNGDFAIGAVTAAGVELNATRPSAGTGNVTYTTYRATTPVFTPGAGNQIDSQVLAPGVPYFYLDASAPTGGGVFYRQTQSISNGTVPVNLDVTPGKGTYGAAGGTGNGWNFGNPAWTQIPANPHLVFLMVTHSVLGNAMFLHVFASALAANDCDVTILSAGLDGTNTASFLPAGGTVITGGTDSLYANAVTNILNAFCTNWTLSGGVVHVFFDLASNEASPYTSTYKTNATTILNALLALSLPNGWTMGKVFIPFYISQPYKGATLENALCGGGAIGQGASTYDADNVALAAANPSKVFTIGKKAASIARRNQAMYVTDHPNGPNCLNLPHALAADVFSILNPTGGTMTIARSTGALLGTNESTGVSIANGASSVGSEVDVLGDNTSKGDLALYLAFGVTGSPDGLIDVVVSRGRVSGQEYVDGDGLIKSVPGSSAGLVFLGRIPTGRYMQVTVKNRLVSGALTNVAVLYELEKTS